MSAYFTQEITDHHCKAIRDALKQGDTVPIQCLNYLKNASKDLITRRNWQWVGAQLVMSGHLTVDDENNYQIKSDL